MRFSHSAKIFLPGPTGIEESFHRTRATDRIVIVGVGFGLSGSAQTVGIICAPGKDGKLEREAKFTLAASSL